ncbi:carotenoid biosynthesis protein [Ferroplasma acidiphilum]|uniref:carotenoid biosynthesis protein n=1 Tax=Ferroplasma acidiphilum TaxID=74969 RepID=UPI002815541A|nr:carotenoid biosynthesis protein [Ferroplasma acidiphilum]WMT52349.1 MAG: carotenoid biosynthesis protein [Ferroplasma acidiphilum]
MKTEWLIAYAYLASGIVMLIAYIFTHIYDLSVFMEIIFIPFYFYHSIKFKGANFTLKFFAASYILAFFIEFLGVHTGIPFGRYIYSSILGPELLGVPVAIPFLWSSLLYFSWLAGRGKIVTSSILMVAIDLSFDPRFSIHLWHWAVPGIYFGVPLTNFAGWFIASISIFAVLLLILPGSSKFSINALIFYTLLGLFQCIEDAVVALYLPALISAVIFVCIFAVLYYSHENGIRKHKKLQAIG